MPLLFHPTMAIVFVAIVLFQAQKQPDCMHVYMLFVHDVHAGHAVQHVLYAASSSEVDVLSVPLCPFRLHYWTLSLKSICFMMAAHISTLLVRVSASMYGVISNSAGLLCRR